ncbi:DUF1540 domain-containing protein [Acetivibrio sp. MSJd-27]|uniref:DUF1540 domain-containing protein n=1 Tax=Acetivibrio sp. MSJd-27 TaxID=2841523 RepID=UPI001C11DB4F|nr:DUF1540 domain-containing protein [Acetivibrio sp. MSJd-27]MBU5451389.1 DUF1540 domain-containing protein [Acetivibrio sp. MSJd-27]
MNKVNCDVTNCAYNHEQCCKAAAINIDGLRANADSETCCGTFVDEKHGGSNLSNSCGNEDCSCLNCDALNCKHNEDCRCSLSEIDVCRCDNNVCSCDQTCCGSFEEES